MGNKRYLIKLTDQGLNWFKSNDVDLTKPFVVEGIKDTHYLKVGVSETMRLGIYTPKGHGGITTQCYFRHLRAWFNTDPDIIIIHEDI